uniref:Uncharacterized protein n=1 Tax=Corethron hystrix TaxID=216773 RepID=A0A7S1BRL2_9STRA
MWYSTTHLGSTVDRAICQCSSWEEKYGPFGPTDVQIRTDSKMTRFRQKRRRTGASRTSLGHVDVVARALFYIEIRVSNIQLRPFDVLKHASCIECDESYERIEENSVRHS